MKCNKCENTVEYNGGICEFCGGELTLTSADIEEARRELSDAILKKNTARIPALREILADAGDNESRREYAKYLERTDSVKRNLDLAMKYYKLAAEEGDAHSAYRYSVLVGRTGAKAGEFWLKYAGVLGAIDAYPPLAEYFSDLGIEEVASYYYYLAACHDDTSSIVTMAKRYMEGVGVCQNDSFAKWYLDKFKIPPVSAIKAAYKLRGVNAMTPPKLTFPDYQEYLSDLADEARACRFDTAYYKITSMLAEDGDIESKTTLAKLTAEGIGTSPDANAALRMLNEAADSGSTDAMMYLAGAYSREDSFTGEDIALATEYYERAAKLGVAEGYMRIGDIFRSAKHSDDGIPDFIRAAACYKIAAGLGCDEAMAKLEDMNSRKEMHYKRGMETLGASGSVTRQAAEDAFKSLYIAAAYGKSEAYRPLAKCYAYGFGCNKSRSDAFKYFSLANDAGDKDALLPLALCYSRGFGIAFNYDLAVKYLSEAKRAGSEEAAIELARLKTRKMKKAVRALYSTVMRLIYMKKYEPAFKILTDFRPLGYPKAIYTLGCMYEFGLGTECNKKAAADCYNQARTPHASFGVFIDNGAAYKSRFLKLLRAENK